MSSARALLLALALESSNGDDPRHLRSFRKRKTAFFATLVLRPEEFAMLGLVEEPNGLDVLWDWRGVPRLRFGD